MALAMACVAAMEVFTAEATERARLEWAMSEEQIASEYRQIRAASPHRAADAVGSFRYPAICRPPVPPLRT